MRKILISWIAYNHDFMRNEDGRTVVNPNGTHSDFYNHLFDYDTHLLLSSSSDKKPDLKFQFLFNYLVKEFNKNTLSQYLDIEDIISIEEIKNQLFPLLLDYKEYAVEVFVSPGTPSMQTVWYLLAMEFKNMKLFQVRPPKHRNGLPPKKEYIEVEHSGIANGLVIREQNKRKITKPTKFIFTPTILNVFEKAKRISDTNDVTALILGETGTGKEVLAKHIHQNSLRNKHRFIAINCAALGDELLESRLFGHKKGAFTDAEESEGAFLEAHKGTIFLDEIGDISSKLQQTLLRVLQERTVSPIGSFEEKKVNVRVIVATHKNLWDQVEKGKFRADLFYRIAVAHIETISFKELPKKERDIFFEFFLEKKAKLFSKTKLMFEKKAKQCVYNYSFPGNIREVENLIERLYVYCDDMVLLEDIPKRIRFPEGTSASLILKDIENRHIQKVLKMYGNNIKKSSEILDIAVNTLKSRLEKYNL